MIRLIIWIRPFSKFLLIGWILAIITVSSIPSLPMLKIHTEKADIRLDYLMHFCEYGLLAFTAFLAFAGKDFRVSFRKYLFLIISLIVFAVLDECHQKLIPGRSFNPKDIAGNILGIIAALIFCIMVFRIISSKLTDLV